MWAAAEVCCRWGLPGTSWSLSVCDPRRNSRGLTGLLFIPPHPRLVPGPTGAFRAPTPPRPGPCGARAAGHPAPGPWAGGSVPASWSPGWQRQPGGSRRRLGQGTHGGGRAGLPGSAAGHLSPPSGPRAPRPTLGCEGQGAGIRGGACIPQQQERPAPAPRGPFALRSGREISVSRKFQLVLRPQRCPGPVRLPAELLVGLCLISGKDDKFLTGNFCEVSACPLKSAFFFFPSDNTWRHLQTWVRGGGAGRAICWGLRLHTSSPSAGDRVRPREPPRQARLRPDPLRPPRSCLPAAWRVPGAGPGHAVFLRARSCLVLCCVWPALSRPARLYWGGRASCPSCPPTPGEGSPRSLGLGTAPGSWRSCRKGLPSVPLGNRRGRLGSSVSGL